MFNNHLFFSFANQATHLLPRPGTVLYRDFVNDKQLNGPISSYRSGPDFTFVRNSYATYIDNLSTLKTASYNEPRFNHIPQQGYQGLLIEDQKTNLVEYSQNFTQVWEPLLSSVAVTSNVSGISAIDNTQTVTLLQPTTSDGFHALVWTGTPAPLSGESGPIDLYNRSIFVKKETARYIIISCSAQLTAPAGGGNPSFETVSNIFDFDLPGFTQLSVPTAYFEKHKDGWFRIGLTRLSTNFNTNRLAIGISNGPNFTDTKFAGTVGNLSGVYIWGGQTEKGPVFSSYIPTNGSQVTRAPDNVYVDRLAFTSFYCLTGGTYSTIVSRNSIYDTRAIATFRNIDMSKYMTLGTSVSGNTHTFTNTSNLSVMESSSVNANQYYKLTVGFKENDFVFYQNGVLVSTLSSGSLPQPPFRLNRFELGQFNNSRFLNGHIRLLNYIPTRLSNQQLSAL